MTVKLKRISYQRDELDASNSRWKLLLEIEGRMCRWHSRGANLDDALADAYFFHTGKQMSINLDDILIMDETGEDQDLRFAAGLEWDRYSFTDELADPDDFKHIEKVPPWSTAE